MHTEKSLIKTYLVTLKVAVAENETGVRPIADAWRHMWDPMRAAKEMVEPMVYDMENHPSVWGSVVPEVTILEAKEVDVL